MWFRATVCVVWCGVVEGYSLCGVCVVWLRATVCAVWCGVVQSYSLCGVVQGYSFTWCGVAWSGVQGYSWCGVVWFRATVLCGVVWFRATVCVVWCDSGLPFVWCGDSGLQLVWCGVVQGYSLCGVV